MNTTNYWQIAGLVLSLVQFLLYIAGFIKYKDKLEDLADSLISKADEKMAAYKLLRSRDPKFFDFYCDLPLYTQCDSNIRRSKGAAFADYGKAMRRVFPTVNGYTPYQRAALAHGLGQNPVQASAVKRMQTHIAERAREDDHLLRRWQAITGSPTNVSSNMDVTPIIKQSFS